MNYKTLIMAELKNPIEAAGKVYFVPMAFHADPFFIIYLW